MHSSTVGYYYCLHGLANCFVDFAFDILSQSPLIIVINHHHVLVQSNFIIGLVESTMSTFVLAKCFVDFAFDISQSPTEPSQLRRWPLLKSTKATFSFSRLDPVMHIAHIDWILCEVKCNYFSEMPPALKQQSAVDCRMFTCSQKMLLVDMHFWPKST